MKTKFIFIMLLAFILCSNSYANNQWITKKENNKWITKKSVVQNDKEIRLDQKRESLLKQYRQYLLNLNKI